MDPRDLDSSRPGRLGFGKAQDPADPDGERRLTVWVVKGDLAKKVKHQPWVAYNIDTAFEVLQAPARIYRGTRKDNEGTWHGTCYVGKTTHYRNDNGDRIPMPADRLYMAFVKDNGDLHEWGKEPCDPRRPDEPLDVRTDPRFKELLWPAIAKGQA